MTERELKKLSRSDLLELMIAQGKELEDVKQQLAEALKELEERKISCDSAGSIAEASLAINGVFLAAQAAADDYLSNIKSLNDRQDAILAERDRESREKAEARINEAEAKSSLLEEETKQRCSKLEQETAFKCAKMEEQAKANSEAWWMSVQNKLRTMYQSQSELRSLMTNFGITGDGLGSGANSGSPSDGNAV